MPALQFHDGVESSYVFLYVRGDKVVCVTLPWSQIQQIRIDDVMMQLEEQFDIMADHDLESHVFTHYEGR